MYQVSSAGSTVFCCTMAQARLRVSALEGEDPVVVWRWDEESRADAAKELLGPSARGLRVSFVDGSTPPKILGESYYWTTPSGLTRVRHPSAYAHRGGRPVYHRSTRHIVCGRDWRPSAK